MIESRLLLPSFDIEFNELTLTMCRPSVGKGLGRKPERGGIDEMTILFEY